MGAWQQTLVATANKLPCRSEHEPQAETSTGGFTGKTTCTPEKGLRKTITMMQDFMVQKGIIDNSMSEEEMVEICHIYEAEETARKTQTPKKKQATGNKQLGGLVSRVEQQPCSNINQSPSEVIIYKGS